MNDINKDLSLDWYVYAKKGWEITSSEKVG